jgi:hypothetical protein
MKLFPVAVPADAAASGEDHDMFRDMLDHYRVPVVGS